MIITFARSSSISSYENYCQTSWFITYNLGIQQEPNVKTVVGSATHLVLECIAMCKKYLQENPTDEKFTINNPTLGDITTSREEMYKEEELSIREVSEINKSRACKYTYLHNVQLENGTKRIGRDFVQDLIKRSCYYYAEKSFYEWETKHYLDARNFVWMALECDNGRYDPRNRTIVEPEREFSITFDEDWARYTYNIGGEKVDGNFGIKGTIDLITQTNDKEYEIIDWKGLPIDTPIPTINGWSTMGNLLVGDRIFDEFGNITTIIGKSNKTIKDCYKIIFDDKTEVICDKDHLWKLSNGSIKNILELNVKDKINVAKPLSIKDIELPIEPYLLGLWLGDGRNRTGEISSSDSFIFDEIKKLGYSIGDNLEKRDGYCEVRTVYKLRTKLRKLNLLKNKHIPEIYFRASFEQRLKLLHGLMDSDGNVNVKRKQAVFTNCNKRLSDDMKELLLSLGQRPNQSNVTRNIFESVVNVYPIHFRPLNINPFSLPRKANKINANWGSGNSHRRMIKSIIPVGKMETQCISVDSPSKTYLCTKNMIPTHNTGQRKDWGTGKTKDYEYLQNDIQLMLYYYAATKLYPDIDEIFFTIFFIRHGGPFTICFDKSHLVKMKKFLREHFEKVKANIAPSMIHPLQQDFRCNKLCHFYKNDWPGTNKNICKFVQNSIQTQGLQKTIELYKSENFKFDTYSQPGI